ncbi:MAG: hypothetical protein HYV04_19280 [Deltaproteobacteria bacterium]|nr:hypothetical protein [Deltaproteobacteria bacterium]
MKKVWLIGLLALVVLPLWGCVIAPYPWYHPYYYERGGYYERDDYSYRRGHRYPYRYRHSYGSRWDPPGYYSGD